MKKQKADFYTFLPLPAYLIMILLFLLPVASILKEAFYLDGKFSFYYILDALKSKYTFSILFFTIKQAFDSTLVSLLLGLPGAFILAKTKIKGKNIINAFCTIPFVLPAIFVVLGFVIFYGNSGVINTLAMSIFNLEEPPFKILYSYKAIILAHAFYNFPIILILVERYLENLDSRLEMASLTLGASRFKTFCFITVPRVLPIILSSSFLVFLFCFSSFSIILVLGGGPKFTTMEVEIFQRARTRLDIPSSSAFALLSIIVSTALLLVYIHIQKKTKHYEYGSSINNKKTPKVLVVLAVIYSIAITVFILGPIISIVVKSFIVPGTRGLEDYFSFKWYRILFGFENSTGALKTSSSALISSFTIAFLVAVLSIPTAASISYSAVRQKGMSSSLIEVMGMLPMAVSSVIIGLGYFIISSLFIKNITINYILVVLAHLIISIPFALRTILPEMRKIPLTYAKASRSLGASKMKTFFLVELPMLKSALISGAVFSFALSMGEINATLTLANSKITTLPIVMYRLIGSYQYNAAAAIGTILIITCLLVFILSDVKRNTYGE